MKTVSKHLRMFHCCIAGIEENIGTVDVDMEHIHAHAHEMLEEVGIPMPGQVAPPGDVIPAGVTATAPPDFRTREEPPGGCEVI